MERLSDGTPITIRPIQPSDRELLAGALAHLSPASVRARFLAPKDHFTQRELDYLTQVDGYDHVALVAEVADDPGQWIGVGRYVRLPDQPDTAEVAITVADEWQGKGLGRLLGTLLAQAAGECGIRQFVATMLADNVASHRLFASMSDRLQTHHQGSGIDELVVPLAA
jgi:RimJ/RimL family protein N-acetyltransferase